MEDFKVGDRVQVIGEPDNKDAGTVSSTRDSAHGPVIVVDWDDSGFGGDWYANELYLIKPANPAIVPEYLAERVGHAGEGDKPDMVNHPPHYNAHPKGIECIDIIEENPFILLGNAMKYLWRVSWGGKGNDVEDLNKAIWYIQRELKRRENAES